MGKSKILSPKSSACRTEAPIETWAHSTDLSPLNISMEDDYVASLKQIPFFSRVCQIVYVSDLPGKLLSSQ